MIKGDLVDNLFCLEIKSDQARRSGTRSNAAPDSNHSNSKSITRDFNFIESSSHADFNGALNRVVSIIKDQKTVIDQAIVHKIHCGDVIMESVDARIAIITCSNQVGEDGSHSIGLEVDNLVRNSLGSVGNTVSVDTFSSLEGLVGKGVVYGDKEHGFDEVSIESRTK